MHLQPQLLTTKIEKETAAATFDASTRNKHLNFNCFFRVFFSLITHFYFTVIFGYLRPEKANANNTYEQGKINRKYIATQWRSKWAPLNCIQRTLSTANHTIAVAPTARPCDLLLCGVRYEYLCHLKPCFAYFFFSLIVKVYDASMWMWQIVWLSRRVWG